MNERRPSRVDQLIDLLVEEIEERMRGKPQPVRPGDLPVVPHPGPPATPPPEPKQPVPAGAGVAAEADLPLSAPAHEVEREAEPERALPPAGPSHAARLMGRLALGVLVVIVLVNIPFNRYGRTLATAMPDSASLVIRSGLVVTEESSEEIYVYQNDQFRWISSLDAFEHFGFTWGDVHVVEDGFLDQFEIGSPIHVLLKCLESPHIYRLERGLKRWIVDIKTFEAEGHVWDDVRFVSCDYLRELPDGETIPPDKGPPPQP